MDLRTRVIRDLEEGSSIRKVAKRFGVGKNFVQNLKNRQKTLGHIEPFPQGGGVVSPAMVHKEQLMEIVAQKPDATLLEYSELLFEQTGAWVSQSAMCRTLEKLELPRKKKRHGLVKRKVSECSS
jgi:transposase